MFIWKMKHRELGMTPSSFFTEACEYRKLREVFSEQSERGVEGELISGTINFGVVKASELDRKDNSSDDKSDYKKAKVGET